MTKEESKMEKFIVTLYYSNGYPCKVKRLFESKYAAKKYAKKRQANDSMITNFEIEKANKE